MHRAVKRLLLDGVSLQDQQDQQATASPTSPLASTLNDFMRAQSHVTSEWSWWWAAACGTTKRPRSPHAGTVLQWSVSDAFGVSVFVWIDDVGRGAWIRAVHPKLLPHVEVGDDKEDALTMRTNAAKVELRTFDAVTVKWWWDSDRGVNGLRFEWVQPSIAWACASDD